MLCDKKDAVSLLISYHYNLIITADKQLVQIMFSLQKFSRTNIFIVTCFIFMQLLLYVPMFKWHNLNQSKLLIAWNEHCTNDYVGLDLFFCIKLIGIILCKVAWGQGSFAQSMFINPKQPMYELHRRQL